MTAFTQPELKAFRVDFALAVQAVEAKYGIKLSIGSITYDGPEFSASMKARREGLRMQDRPEAQLFVYKASHVGLSATDLGRTFWAQGRQLEITGWLKDCSTNVIELKDVASGKMLKCSPAYVKAHMPAA